MKNLYLRIVVVFISLLLGSYFSGSYVLNPNTSSLILVILIGLVINLFFIGLFLLVLLFVKKYLESRGKKRQDW